MATRSYSIKRVRPLERLAVKILPAAGYCCTSRALNTKQQSAWVSTG